MHRRWVLLGLVAAALCGPVALVTCLLLTTQPRATREQFARVLEGMTEAEVADLLGGPPDRWEDVESLPEEDRVQVGDWDEPRPWIGDDCVLIVRFCDGRATAKELYLRDTAQDGILGRLRRLRPW